MEEEEEEEEEREEDVPGPQALRRGEVERRSDGQRQEAFNVPLGGNLTIMPSLHPSLHRALCPPHSAFRASQVPGQ